MRFRLFCLIFGITLLFSSSGCVKDNNNITGLVIQNSGIGFPLAANNKNNIILRPASAIQQVRGLLFVNLEDAAPAISDIHISIADNSTAQVNAYNADNGTAVQPLSRALWSIPSELVIKKGERNAVAEIIINNTTGINLAARYGIGITITGASGGMKIAGNLKNLFILLDFRNALDGKYNMRGESYHPAIAPFFIRHNIDVELHTTGANSVKVFWPVTGYGLPIFDISGNPIQQGIFTNLTLSYIFSTPSNLIYSYNDNPASPTFYTRIGSYNGNSYNNRWDPLTGTLYAAWGYNLAAGGTIVFGASRAYIDTLTYLGPR